MPKRKSLTDAAASGNMPRHRTINRTVYLMRLCEDATLKRGKKAPIFQYSLNIYKN